MANNKQIFKDPLGNAKGIFYFRIFFFVIFLTSFTKSFSQTTFVHPHLVVTEAKKNFGSVKRGEVVKNEYEIRNTGKEPLIISGAEVPCSCTTVDFPKQPILFGETVKVVVTFNTASVYGRQDRVVYLISNDPEGPQKLRYKGTVSNK